jgi:RsiW-degrading membrane proteinase PrsW (M82 family)
MDGIIYGSIAGLGMAVAESVNHLSFLPDKPSALPATEVVRLLGHLVLGGISCYGIGLMRVDARDARKILLIAVSFAVTWHFVWDWIAFSSWSFGAVVLWQKGAAVVLMVTGIFVYGACVASGPPPSLGMAPHTFPAVTTQWRRDMAGRSAPRVSICWSR